MLQSIIRAVALIGLTWMVAKGWITQAQADSNLPTIVSAVSLIALLLSSIVWSYLERWYKGLFPNSPYPPSNLPQVSNTTKEINTVSNISSLTPTPNSSKL